MLVFYGNLYIKMEVTTNEKKKGFLVTTEDTQSYRILKDCFEKRLKASDASQILGLSYIHTLRLKKKKSLRDLSHTLFLSNEMHTQFPSFQRQLLLSLPLLGFFVILC